MTANRIIPFAAVLFFVSCGQAKLKPGAYREWVTDPGNGLRKKQEIGPVTFVLQYKPTDYLIASRGLKTGAFEENPEALKKGATLSLFDLYITCGDGNVHPYFYNSTPDMGDTRQRYYSFYMANDIRLNIGATEYAPVFCRAERGAMINNTLTLECGFDTLPLTDDWTFILNDTQLGAGLVKFTLSKKQLENIPLLTY